LLYRVLRSFHGAEAGYLSDGVENRVTTTSVVVVEALLRQMERDGVTENAEKHAVVVAWRKFVRLSTPATVIGGGDTDAGAESFLLTSA
jgi:hypothetical protein